MTRRSFLVLSLVLLLVEVAIALWLHDPWIRPYGGDTLAVVVLYTLVQSVRALPPLRVTACVLLFAFVVELLQACAIVERLGLGHSQLARTIIGTQFAWGDLLAYCLGALAILVMTYRRQLTAFASGQYRRARLAWTARRAKQSA